MKNTKTPNRKKCPTCKRLFIVKSAGQKYCSQRCVSKHEHKTITVKCVECGDEFLAKNKRALYCSKTCKNIHAYKRKCAAPKPVDPKWLRGPRWEDTSRRRMGCSMTGAEL